MDGEARWAPDPYRRHELRYWDGSRWTEHVSEGDGTILEDAVPAGAVPVSLPASASLPVPRGRRQARTHADDVEHLAQFVGGAPAAVPSAVPSAAAPAPSRPRAVPLPTPSGGTRGAAPAAFAGPALASTQAAGPAGRPVGPQGPVPGGAPGQGRRGDLFDALPGSGARVPSVAQELRVDEPVGWDWRESHVPEILSGIAVALLIAVAAVLGSGRFSGAGADAVQSVVSTGSASPASVATSRPAAATTKKRTTVPGAQVSTAKGGTGGRRSSSTRVRTSSTSTSSRTTAPTSSSSTSDTSTSSSSSSSSSSSPAVSSSSTKTKKTATPSP